MFALCLFLLCTTHAILYSYKKMDGFEIPGHFFLLFFSADIFRSLPFILNLSFALSLVTWRYSHKLKAHDIVALISGFQNSRYTRMLLTFASLTFSMNALALFWAYPALNYKIETQLYPKMVQHTIMALSSKQAFELDKQHFIYFESFDQVSPHEKHLVDIQLLNFDQQQCPYLIVASRGLFQEDKGSLLLENGAITPLRNDEQELSQNLHFKTMEYKIKPSHVDVSAQSFGARQLLFSQHLGQYSILFWKLFLTALPFLFVYVFSHSPIRLKYQAQLNYCIALATAFFLICMIIGVIAMKALAQGKILTFSLFMLALALISKLLKEIYIYVS